MSSLRGRRRRCGRDEDLGGGGGVPDSVVWGSRWQRLGSQEERSVPRAPWRPEQHCGCSVASFGGNTGAFEAPHPSQAVAELPGPLTCIGPGQQDPEDHGLLGISGGKRVYI